MTTRYKKYANIPRAKYYRRERVPTIIQLEAAECGAAALSMILSYYGKYVSLEEVRTACGVTRDGASIIGILKAGASYGLLAESHLINLESLYDMPLPLIVFWNFNHFVVIEGFARDQVYINDPATGPYAISYEQLNRSFTGMALIFDVGINFEPSGKPKSIMETLVNLVKKAKIPFGYAFLAGLGLVIPALALPAFTQFFIDLILVQRIFIWGGWLLFVMGLVVVVTIILKYVQLRVLSRLFIQLSTAFSSEFLWHVLRLPYYFYVQRYTGEIANRMQLTDEIAKTLTTRLTGMIIDAIVATMFGIVMFYYDPIITAFGMAIITLDLILMRYLYRSREDAYYYYQQTSGRSQGYSISALKGIDTLKASGMEQLYFSRWAGFYTKSINALQIIGQKDLYAGIFPSFLKMLTIVMILSFGAWRVINGYLTVGMLIALTMLMDNFIAPITRLLDFSQVAQLLKVDSSRLEDVLDHPLEPSFVNAENNAHKKIKQFPYPKLHGLVELRDITFGFNKSEDPILKNISFTIKPGAYVGLVGSTGSGKSTLTKIISGLLQPLEGSVLFDDVTREQLPRSLINNSIAIVEQEPVLFSATIKDNISFFDPLITLEEVVKAAKDACIHDMIVERKGGYDLVLETNGSNLSGGERQRIEIARALIKQPSILILDEATSALDTDTEARVMQNIRRRGCTCFIIAHRVNTISYCDEILTLDKGRIVQRGTPEELLKVSGLYRDFVALEKANQYLARNA